MKFSYDPELLEEQNVTQPVAQPLYLNIPDLDSIALFNNSIYWVSQEEQKTLVKGNLDGWQNSTQVLV